MSKKLPFLVLICASIQILSAENGPLIGHVFSVDKSTVVVTGPGINTVKTGSKIIIVTPGGTISAIVRQNMHTQLKCSIAAKQADSITKGDAVHLPGKPSVKVVEKPEPVAPTQPPLTKPLPTAQSAFTINGVWVFQMGQTWIEGGPENPAPTCYQRGQKFIINYNLIKVGYGTGYFTDEKTVETDFREFGKHKGTFLDDDHIAWSNGSVWKRKAPVSDAEALKLFKTYKYE